jgi:hypothetical protein
VLHKSPKIDESRVMRPFIRARFPPYSNFKGTVVKAFGGLSGNAAKISKYGTADQMDALAQKHITGRKVNQERDASVSM